MKPDEFLAAEEHRLESSQYAQYFFTAGVNSIALFTAANNVIRWVSMYEPNLNIQALASIEIDVGDITEGTNLV